MRCVKCGTPNPVPKWLPKGSVHPKGSTDLRDLGAPVGISGKCFTAVRECVRWACDCGYVWLAKTEDAG